MNYDLEKSGNRIRQLRIKSGFIQEQIAEVLNIDRSFYSRIESGKSGCSVDLLVQLSELFKVSLDYLILGKYSRNLLTDTERLVVKKELESLIVRLEEVRGIF